MAKLRIRPCVEMMVNLDPEDPVRLSYEMAAVS